jgi:hypothetical protein
LEKARRKKLSDVEDSIARSLGLETLLPNLLHCRCASSQAMRRRFWPSERLRYISGRASRVAQSIGSVAAWKRELWQTECYSAWFVPARLRAGELRQASLRVAYCPQQKRLFR